MGIPFAYVMTKKDWIQTGGIGCRVCWRWMQESSFESHKAGKKHIRRLEDRQRILGMQPGAEDIRPGPVEAEFHPNGDVDINFDDPATIFEIMFPAAQNKDTVYSRDANLDLDSLYRRPNEPEPVD